jgi:hypothetical protein
LPTIAHFCDGYPELLGRYGFTCSLNPTFPDGTGGRAGWLSTNYYGLNEGPIILMIENYRHEMPWNLMRGCEYLVRGLQRAGFTGGWLDRSGA